MLLDKTRHYRLTAVVVILAALVWVAVRASPIPAPQQQPVIRRAATTNVTYRLTVTDPLNRFVTGLGKENFKVLQNGKEREILQFSGTDTPLSAGVVFDVSDRGNLDAAREAVVQFLRNANPEDEFFLVQFAGRPELVTGFIPDSVGLRNKVSLLQSNGQTALADGIAVAVHGMKQARNARKAILIFSDSLPGNALKDAAGSSDAQIFSIGMSNPAGSTDSPGSQAARIGIELRNQYLIGFSRTDEVVDGANKVWVELVPPRGLPPLNLIVGSIYRSGDRAGVTGMIRVPVGR
jgi:Ca-activated chloride channel homolog